MKMNFNVRVKRIFTTILVVSIFPLLIYQFVNALPPAQDDGIPVDDGLSMPELSDGGPPISPVYIEQKEQAFSASPNEVNKDITFDIYYGQVQNYGQIGNPQPWVDILGRVYPSDSGNKITSLKYSLNGGADIPLSIGADLRRLALKGEFHIELDHTLLSNGPNTVLIKAVDNGGQQGQTTVTVNYSAGNSWPMNYTADWSTIVSHTDILDLAQVVDGAWEIQNGKLVPFYQLYDRMVAIGEENTWDDYEVTVPVTINALNPDGFKPVPAGPGVGLILRWPGYFQKASEQPRIGWENLGALMWNRWKKHANGSITSGLQAIGYGGKEVETNPDVQLQFGVTYIYKASVQTSGPTGSIYRFKVWKEGDPEPNAWDMIVKGDPNGPTTGSLILIAHYVDVSFGKVTVKPLSSIKPKLTVTIDGNGTVTQNPNKVNYNYGEAVQLDAIPGGGQALGRWSGDLTGRTDPVSLTLTSDTNITAHFVPEVYVNVAVSTNGGGSVDLDPDQAQYLVGEELTLTAVPSSGFRFSNWTRDLSGSENPKKILIEGEMDIRAIFDEIPTYSVTINTPVGEGSVVKVPDKAEYEEGEEVKLTAVPDVGYVFSEWSGDLTGSQNPAYLTVDSDKSITPIFVEGQSYSLSVSVGSNGQVLIDPDKASYAHGEIVKLTAVPDAGYMLEQWGGDLTGSSSPSIIEMTKNSNVSATFVPAIDPQSDDFNRCNLDNGLWTVSDPVGDTTMEMTGTNFVISIPGGVSHDLWTGNNQAPRILTPAENTDFEVEAKFDSIVDQVYQIQGIMIRQDNQNFLRFDFHFDGSNMKIFAAKFVNGTATQTNSQVVTGSPAYMRVKRIGNDWYQYYSTDGLQWTLSKKFTHPLIVSEAGVFAGTAGNFPAFTASIDYFFNTAMPIVPEDETQYTLNVTENGNGSVSVSPDKENYTCNEVVQLTANPGSGSQFSGWSGDLSGVTNPASLTITRDHNVTANFTTGTNKPPVFGITPDQFVVAGNQLSFNISATDPDGGNPPSLSVTSKPAAATFTDNGNGTGVFKWTPTTNDIGEHSVTFEASDGVLVTSKNVKINVVNEAPGKVYLPIILYKN